jgi:glycosyltransferase involved in cell wall biosynthesis
MAAGLPAVGVVSPGVGDTVEDGVTGFLTSEDAAPFAERMLELAEDDELRARMSEAATAAAREFDITVLGAKMLDRYERLITARSSSRDAG